LSSLEQRKGRKVERRRSRHATVKGGEPISKREGGERGGAGKHSGEGALVVSRRGFTYPLQGGGKSSRVREEKEGVSRKGSTSAAEGKSSNSIRGE